jgi:hypothetical protein
MGLWRRGTFPYLTSRQRSVARPGWAAPKRADRTDMRFFGGAIIFYGFGESACQLPRAMKRRKRDRGPCGRPGREDRQRCLRMASSARSAPMSRWWRRGASDASDVPSCAGSSCAAEHVAPVSIGGPSRQRRPPHGRAWRNHVLNSGTSGAVSFRQPRGKRGTERAMAQRKGQHTVLPVGPMLEQIAVACASSATHRLGCA